MLEGYALYVDYEFCSGCKSCELACKNEHGFGREEWGIRVLEDKPWKKADGHWNWNYLPVPSDLCDLCAERFEKGQEPSCVQQCQAKVIEFGTYGEVAEKMAAKRKSLIFRP